VGVLTTASSHCLRGQRARRRGKVVDLPHNFPQMSALAWSPDLIDRLLKKFGNGRRPQGHP
jgi:hypothetical protein